MRNRLVAFTIFAALLIGLAGCGGSGRSAVSGKVTVAGKGPLTGGTITFVSVSEPDKMSGGQIKPDGTYSVSDAPVGECKVLIDNSHMDPNAKRNSGMPQVGAGPGGMGMKGAPMKGPAKASGPRASDKEKMSKSPKGVEVADQMEADKDDWENQKYMKIDPSFYKADSTTLKADVRSGSNTFDFEVK